MKQKISNLFKYIPALILLYNGFGFYEHLDSYLTEKGNIEAEKEKIAAEIKKDELWLIGVKKFVANIDKAKEEVREAEGQIEFVQKQLPTDVSDTEILEHLSREASFLNIQNFSVVPKDEMLNGFYFAKQFEFKGEGTFLQFLVLFERLGRAERIFNVRNLLFDPLDKRNKGRYQMIKLSSIIESYRYNINYKPESILPTGGVK